jgi:hypothetical protein
MQQRTNAESIRAESEKVRQANEERLREKRMVRVPLFDPHSRVGMIFFCLGDALIDLDAGHVYRHDDRPSLNFFGTFARTFFPTLPLFLSSNAV